MATTIESMAVIISMEQQATNQAKETVDALGITVTSKFVPFSQSRHKGDKEPGLNWVVTLIYKGRPILTTDYGAGCGHCPSYKQWTRTIYQAKAIAWECEHGTRHRENSVYQFGGKPILPSCEDVISSLLRDASVNDCATFEEWAGDLGYDTDSRKAEAIYRACLEIGLKLRNGLGEDVLRQLREAFQDY